MICIKDKSATGRWGRVETALNFMPTGSYAKAIGSDILFVFEACWRSMNVKQRFGRQTKLRMVYWRAAITEYKH